MKEFNYPIDVQLHGDWRIGPEIVKVTQIDISEELIRVSYTGTKEVEYIYQDIGFEEELGQLLGKKVIFADPDIQDSYVAVLEPL